jgi:hypothetical protein
MFKGLGNLGDLGNLVKEAAKMKQKMEALQAQLAERVVESSSGGGMVKVRANGRQEILAVEIDDEVLASSDKQMLQDLVAAACNSALANSREMMREELSKLAGGLGISLPDII